MIYQPEEDSYFLEEFVKEYAVGKVLDMGTGSGIQAIAASKKPDVSKVVAVDINEEAVNQLKQKATDKISVVHSDLFSKLEGKFNTILFNPPYLPNEKEDLDLSLDGGKVGYELIEKFLKQAKNHLEKDGIILLLFSNRTGRKEVLSIIKRENYEAVLLSSKQLPFFEELYVYKLRLKDETEVFNKGKRGVIYKKGMVAIKEHNPDAKVDTIKHEADVLKVLNTKHIGPKFIKYEEGKLSREFIEGISIEEFFEKANKKDSIVVAKDVLLQCREMDKLGINKQELTNPYKDILITKNKKAVLIDFERCRYTEKPKNVTQFLQYLIKKNVLENKDEVIELGKNYKKILDDKSFKKIFTIIK